MPAYYNEIDPYAAEWLRNLIRAGHLPPGDVDERSISDVRPDDLKPYQQCHFFAGVGVWAAALRRVGWPDDRPIWTGSCPCQPFSVAGAGLGLDDERHLWPDFHYLIALAGPPIVVGEQVASKDADPWLDHVSADMEALGFAFGAVAFPAAGIGAPHIRDRTYWMADSDDARPQGRRRMPQRAVECFVGPGGVVDWMAYAECVGREMALLDPGRGDTAGRIGETGVLGMRGASGGMADSASVGQLGRRASRPSDGRDEARVQPERLCDVVGLADPEDSESSALGGALGAGDIRHAHGDGNASGGAADADGRDARTKRQQRSRQHGQPPQDNGARDVVIDGDTGAGPTNGEWRNADWLFCRDGKWRPVEPGTFPLAHGAPARVGRLRAYGNAINLVQATHFLEIGLTFCTL